MLLCSGFRLWKRIMKNEDGLSNWDSGRWWDLNPSVPSEIMEWRDSSPEGSRKAANVCVYVWFTLKFYAKISKKKTNLLELLPRFKIHQKLKENQKKWAKILTLALTDNQRIVMREKPILATQRCRIGGEKTFALAPSSSRRRNHSLAVFLCLSFNI